MDTDLTPHKAIGLSSKITNGYKFELFGLLSIGFVMVFLTWPFAFGLQNIGSDKGLFYIIVGIIPYLIGFLVINPWLTASWATAYNVLSKRHENV